MKAFSFARARQEIVWSFRKETTEEEVHATGFFAARELEETEGESKGNARAFTRRTGATFV